MIADNAAAESVSREQEETCAVKVILVKGNPTLPLLCSGDGY